MIHIGICHQSMRAGDAICHDILGMYDLLTLMGFQVNILCNYFDDITQASRNTLAPLNQIDPNQFHLLIYHHSIYWEEGEALLQRFQGERIIRYRSVTPATFFRPYSGLHTLLCLKALNQTRHLARLYGNNSLWLAVSAFSGAELLNLGIEPARIITAPPFNHLERYLHPPTDPSKGSPQVLYVGRFTPNKGHRHLVRIIHAYVQSISPDIVLRIVGVQDPELHSYYQEIQALIDNLGVRGQVNCVPYLPADVLQTLFYSSHVFLCTSEHEGFCLPALEAQAAGIPVVSANSTALGDIIGEGQLVSDPPRNDQDYLFYALLLREVCINAALRQTVIDNGYRNVLNRFSSVHIENCFIEGLLPVLRRLSL